MTTVKELEARVQHIEDSLSVMQREIHLHGWFSLPEKYRFFFGLKDGEVFPMNRYPTSYRTGAFRTIKIAEGAPNRVTVNLDAEDFTFPLCPEGQTMEVPEVIAERLEHLGYVEPDPGGTITRIHGI